MRQLPGSGKAYAIMQTKSALRILSVPLMILFLGCFWCGLSEGASPGGLAQPQQDTQQKEVKPLKFIPWTGKPGSNWKAYDKAIKEQKYERAYEIAEGNLSTARASQNSEEWVRALIRCVQTRTALHGYETAVKFLKEEAWPEDLLARTTLHLYYAQALLTYAHGYSWEIRGREKVDSKGVVDLKAWTVEQIFAEARRSYEVVLSNRDQLGEQPSAMLSEYIQLNDYPGTIRPTLRDAVTYLYAEALADTLGWAPGQSDEVYALDLRALLAELPSLQVDHPVAKYCEVLGDLEAWHTGRKEIEAAFEARLERLRKLKSNFSEKADRERIRTDLEAWLPKVRSFPWWSVGMATLAEFVREEDASDNLVRARKIAQDGQTAFPDSIGGKRCLYIIKSIEAPSFKIEAMAQDNLKRASIGIIYTNLIEIYFRAYARNLGSKVQSADDFNVAINSREV
jgi:alpha-2-macroglobulin